MHMLDKEALYPLATKRLHEAVVEVYGKPTDWRTIKRGRPRAGTFNFLTHILEEKKIKQLFTLNPSDCNGFVAEEEGFTPLNLGLLDINTHMRINYGAHADSVFLRPGQAGAIASGDCPVLVLAKKTGAIITHCGRESLLLGMEGKKNSLIQAVEKLRDFTQHDDSDIRGWISPGIRPEHFTHPFDHPEFGKRNQKMVRYIVDQWTGQCVLSKPFGEFEDGMIDLKSIIISEVQKLGIPGRMIEWDTNDTYSSLNLWSHRRAVEEGSEDGRNAVLVHIPRL